MEQKEAAKLAEENAKQMRKLEREQKRVEKATMLEQKRQEREIKNKGLKKSENKKRKRTRNARREKRTRLNVKKGAESVPRYWTLKMTLNGRVRVQIWGTDTTRCFKCSGEFGLVANDVGCDKCWR